MSMQCFSNYMYIVGIVVEEKLQKSQFLILG